MDAHELVAIVKNLALELGRTPTKRDFCAAVKGADYKITKFGGFAALLQAAGLDTYEDRRGGKRAGREVFEKELAPHLEEQHARQAEPRFSNFILPIKDYPTTVVFGDMHEPFSHAGAKKSAIEIVRELKPKRAVQVGDLRDMFSWQKYPRSHNVFTPKEEIELGTRAIGEFWAAVQEASPGIECYQLLGNHDCRPYARVLEAFPALEMLIDLKPLYTFPGVKLIEDPRQELELDGVFFHHGYNTRPGGNRDFMNACFVSGHSHRAGAFYRAIHGGHMLWELNVGTLGDPASKGLSYTPQKHTHQTLGIGVIDKFGPRFIPLR